MDSWYLETDRTAKMKHLLHQLYRASGLNLHKLHAAVFNFPKYYNRPFDSLPLGGVGAEIGVYRGFHARDLLKRHSVITKLFCVDAYLPYGGEINGELAALLDSGYDLGMAGVYDMMFWKGEE